MNAPIRKIAALAAGSLVLAALSGCAAAAFDPTVDSTSPAAAGIRTLTEGHRTYPRWSDFPRQTQPVPPPAEIAARVSRLQGQGEDLAAASARIEWLNPADAQAYAAAARARAATVDVAPPSAETLAEIEAFARRTRERGRAPPPIPRR